MNDEVIGVMGARSPVGRHILQGLTHGPHRVIALSRTPCTVELRGQDLDWAQLEASVMTTQVSMKQLICVAPIWVLPDYLAWLKASGVRRVVCLSSTSRFTKDTSTDLAEQVLARRIASAEQQVQEWAEQAGVEWVILRPTLIYGGGQDRNIAEIARLIRLFGFFPLFGKAQGLRQPIAASDVAAVCINALTAPRPANRAYNLSGGETLPYKEMVARIFAAMGRTPRLLPVPLTLFRMMIAIVHLMPRYAHWSTAMARRMNEDLVFDHGDAMRDLGYVPQPFRLAADDVAA